MTAREPFPATLAEMDRIEAIIAEHGPSTAFFIASKMGMTTPVSNARLFSMRQLGRVHISHRAFDKLTNSTNPNNRSNHYALGADSGFASESSSMRGIKPFRPVYTTWASVTADPFALPAAFFGRMA